MISDTNSYTILSLSNEQKELLSECGSLAYDVSKICVLLEIEDKQAFKAEFNNKDSQIYQLYWQGYYESKLAVDRVSLNDAMAGKSEAIKRWDKEERLRKLDKLKKELDG